MVDLLFTPGFQKSSAKTTVDEAVRVIPVGQGVNDMYGKRFINQGALVHDNI